MKIPFNWLKEYVNLNGLTVDEVSRKLTLAGSEISSIETTGGDIPGVVIGKIISVHKHPDADKLNVCKVDIGSDSLLSIVCGAPNVEENIYIAVATLGAKLPNGITIKKATIRGFESNGMICSRSELGYDEMDGVYGIWILDENIAKLGEPISSIVGSVEHILNVEVTSNRGDLLSIIGFARECSLVLETRVSIPSVATYDSIGGNINIVIENPDACFKYASRLIKDVTITPSPEWMQKRLKMCGINPINNVVDITNYVMIEYGQPIHAYDFDKIKDGKIIVRNAKNGETIELLDGRNVSLTDEVLVIADSEKPIGVAGVMGGISSSIKENTKNILIESAYFDHIAIRKSSTITNTKTDASYRFEREVDHTLTLGALNRVVDLIVTLDKNAKISSHAKEVNAKQFENRRIVFDCDLVKKYLGLSFNRMEIASILKRYGFNASSLGGNSLKVDLPYHRHDLNIAEDLIEEIARVYGYNNLITTVPPIKSNDIKSDYEDLSFIKYKMASYGLWESMHYSMGDSDIYKQIEIDDNKFIHIISPLSSELDVLRPTTLASILNSIAYNQNHRHKSGSLFEIGNIFYKDNDRFIEEKRLSGAMFGMYQDKLWNKEPREYDFFDLSGVLEELLIRDLRCSDYTLTPEENKWFVPTLSANISVFGEHIGIIGKVHPKILSIFEISSNVYFFDLDARLIIKLVRERAKRQVLKDIGKYPAIFRDLALICDKNIEFNRALKAIKKFHETIRNVEVVDRYVGEQIGEGRESIAISITYFDPNRTLREEDINNVEKSLLDMLKNRFEITLRT